MHRFIARRSKQGDGSYPNYNGELNKSGCFCFDPIFVLTMPVFHNACFLIYVLKSLEGIVKYKKRSGETSQKIFAGIQEREVGEITQ